MNFSIIIINWNAFDYLIPCLINIYKDNWIAPIEVFVVDNASSADLLPAIEHKFQQAKIIKNPSYTGFSRANNQAIRQSSGKYILLLNPDTEVKPGALRVMGQFMTAHPEFGIIGPRLLNADGSLQVSGYPFPTLQREFWRLFHLDTILPFGVYDQAQWNLEHPREVDSLHGACLLIRREVFDQIGLLDEDYFMYTEEIDFCYRAKKAGWKIAWLPTAEVIHYGGQSTRQAASSVFLQLYHSKLLFFRKHYGKPAAWAYA